MKPALLLIPVLLLSACAVDGGTGGGALSDQPDNTFIRGTARVVSVDQTLGTAVLDCDGRQIAAYWQTESASPKAIIVVKPDAARPPVTLARQAQTATHTFDAKPGDNIRFLALRTGNTLFLQSIAIVP